MVLNELLPIELEEFLKPFFGEREARNSEIGNFWRGLPRVADTSGFSPRINITDDAKSFVVTAELPGMNEKDVDVQLTKDTLILSGEKKVEHERTEGGRHYFQRASGVFRREVKLGFDVDEDKVEATFAKGVLTLKLPKTVEAQRGTKKITVKTA